MSNANAAYASYDVDEALANWENIKAEVAEEQRRKLIAKTKELLPFTEPLAIEICERVSSGELLINICADEHLPTVSRDTQWIKRPRISPLYRDSISDRLTIFEEEVIKIADDAPKTSETWCATGELRSP